MRAKHRLQARTSLLQFSYRSRFYLMLILLSIPFFVMSIWMSIYSINKQAQNASEIASRASQQCNDRIASLYITSHNLARNLCINPILQGEVLTQMDENPSDLQVNSNIYKLRSLLASSLLAYDIAGVSYILPAKYIVANHNEFLTVEETKALPWFRSFSAAQSVRRFYPTTTGSYAKPSLSVLCPIQNPHKLTEAIGYVKVDVLQSTIQNIIDNSLLYDHSWYALLSNDGSTILQYGHSSAELHDDLPYEQILRAIYQDPANAAQLNGRRYLYIAQRIGTSDMNGIYRIPIKSIIAIGLMNSLFHIGITFLQLAMILYLTISYAKTLNANRDNQLKLLNYQLNPHFLYNTLDMINWEAINKDIPEIYEPIQRLSRFYKISLNRGQDFATVASEVEQMRLYIELQNSRFQNMISYQFDIDPALSECMILHMVLQPILENSILHGIREKESRRGSIHICCQRRTGKDMVFTIQDDGVGMEPKVARNLLTREHSAGYGMHNIQDRLILAYGKKYAMEITSKPGEGTTVTVVFPIEYD